MKVGISNKTYALILLSQFLYLSFNCRIAVSNLHFEVGYLVLLHFTE